MALKTVSVSKPKASNYYSTYKPSTYSSQYGSQIADALNTVTNWKYDPMQDASYQALAKVYAKRGNEAAKNTMADAASLNGGYGTSYAVSAAQQARNQYNQELASLVPDLEANAYQKATGTLSALRDADDTAYGRFRDTEGDKQWQYTQNYQKYRDAVSDYQWGQDYNMSVYQAKKSNSGGGGRRSSGGSGGGGYSGGGPSGTNLKSQYNNAVASSTASRGYVHGASSKYQPEYAKAIKKNQSTIKSQNSANKKVTKK